ncbi:MAG TPA: YceD family protein [Verrucomicrobiae bacterium]|nr:YceD family protein [Verrucomicrobiae bacterium]
MLSVNLRHLETHEVHLEGELPVAELDFSLHDEMIHADQPLRYDLSVEKLHDAILVTGLLELVLDCQCVRCLKPFKHRVALEDWNCHLPLVGEEKTAINNDCVDLTPFLREDMLLEFPPHPLCKPGCGGFEKGPASKTGGKGNAASAAWAELDKLKL